MSAQPALQWEILDHAAAYPVRIGDLVSADAGGLPIYRVIGLSGRDVWLGEERERPTATVMPLDAFRWRGRRQAA
ncbi:MAG: hypothetical protein JF588_15360 [Caulobacterales bacterium]|nr:hypothetical protein [Caulobacterales bacterium]